MDYLFIGTLLEFSLLATLFALLLYFVFDYTSRNTIILSLVYSTVFVLVKDLIYPRGHIYNVQSVYKYLDFSWTSILGIVLAYFILKRFVPKLFIKRS